MNLVLKLPADLEAIIKKRAEQAGLDIPAYVLQTLRGSDLELTGEPSISNEQFEASLNRLREIHAKFQPLLMIAANRSMRGVAKNAF